MGKDVKAVWETLDLLLKATQINNVLVWSASTMAMIAAVNSLLNDQFYKWLVFLVISLASLIMYKKGLLMHMKKGKVSDETE